MRAGVAEPGATRRPSVGGGDIEVRIVGFVRRGRRRPRGRRFSQSSRLTFPAAAQQTLCGVDRRRGQGSEIRGREASSGRRELCLEVTDRG